MMQVFRWLSRLKGLRGTIFDPFGQTAERKMERQLLTDYEADIELRALAPRRGNARHGHRTRRVPEQIRGFGHVKAASVLQARSQADACARLLNAAETATSAA
jgi:indolepyruvate ferredoxin oxidoreductase